VLEVTIRRVTDKLATAKTQAFQFENDALQAFMTEAGPDVGYDVAELRVLGSPIVAEGQRVASVRGKTAGPGAPREAAKPAAHTTHGINLDDHSAKSTTAAKSEKK
jgi:hypothetical protein